MLYKIESAAPVCWISDNQLFFGEYAINVQRLDEHVVRISAGGCHNSMQPHIFPDAPCRSYHEPFHVFVCVFC